MTKRTDKVWKTPWLAAAYLKGVRAAIPLAAEQIDVMLRLAAAGGGVQRFLDLGCGDGVLAAALLERYPQAEAVLADFSEPMLQAARRRFADRKRSPHFLQADYGRPSWMRALAPWRPFDLIVSGYSIHHQPDKRKREVYGEIFRMLRPGGLFINVEHVASASGWLESVYDDLFIDQLHRRDRRVSRAEIARQYYERPDKEANILAPLETQCRWLREIGFVDVDCYLKVFELAVFGGRRRGYSSGG